MKRFLPLILLLASTSWGTEPVRTESDKKTAPAPVVLPDLPPPPMPVPAPTACLRLSSDQLFVVRSGSPCVILSSPDGLVKVTPVSGPITVRGKFVGGTGTVETRTFTETFVYLVEANGTGRGDVLVIPTGATGPGDVLRRCLDVGDGPPPVPPDPPKPPVPPQPPEPTDPLFVKFKAAYLADPDSVGRAAAVNKLEAVYRLGAVGICADTTLATYGDLHTKLASVVGTQLTAQQLAGIRRVIGDELGSQLGTDPKILLDAGVRMKVSAQFVRIAALLDALTP